MLDGNAQRQERSLSIDQLLLRGTVLKNTDSVVGLVLYTVRASPPERALADGPGAPKAPETKVVLNAGRTPSKRSTIDKTMNVQVFVVLSMLVMVCVGCAVADYLWLGSVPPGVVWMVYVDSYSLAAFLSFWCAAAGAARACGRG